MFTQDAKCLSVLERVSMQVVPPQAGIDFSPLIDALMEFLLNLLQNCPARDIRQAAENSARRPLIRAFWALRLRRQMPANVLSYAKDAPAQLLAIGAEMSSEDWAAFGA